MPSECGRVAAITEDHGVCRKGARSVSRSFCAEERESEDLQISGMSLNTNEESSQDPPESPLRYVAACSSPPVPFSTEVEFRPSRALSTPAP